MGAFFLGAVAPVLAQHRAKASHPLALDRLPRMGVPRFPDLGRDTVWHISPGHVPSSWMLGRPEDTFLGPWE